MEDSPPPPQLQLLDLDDDALVAVIQVLKRHAIPRLFGSMGCVGSLATTSKRLCRLARSAAVPSLRFHLDQHAGWACWQASHALDPHVQPLPHLHLSWAEVQAALLTMRGTNHFPGCDEFTVVSQGCPPPHSDDEGYYGTPSDEMGYGGYSDADEDEDMAEELYHEQHQERYKRICQQETLFAWSVLPDVLGAAVRQCPHLTKLNVAILNAPWLTPHYLDLDLAACDIGLAQALGALQPADDLRQLIIQTPWFGPLGMEAVSRLTALTRLHIHDCMDYVREDNMQRAQAVPPQDLSPLRALTMLQHLAISNVLVAPPAPGTLGGYPSSLRRLELGCNDATAPAHDVFISMWLDRRPAPSGITAEVVLPALVSHLGSAGSSLQALTLHVRTEEQLLGQQVMPTVARLAPGLTSLVWSIEKQRGLQLIPCSSWTGLPALRVLGYHDASSSSWRSPLALTAPQHFEVLAQLPRLEVLGEAILRCAPPPHLRLASLTSLSAQCSVTGPQLATLLCCCPRLEQLHCRLQPAPLGEQRPQQSTAGVAAPKGLARCTVVALRSYEERPSDLPDLAAAFEGAAPALQHVRWLHLTWRTDRDNGGGNPCLPSLAALTSLTSLTLESHAWSTIRAGHVVAMVRGCRGPLRELHLHRLPVLTPQLVQDLQGAGPHLQLLHVPECQAPPEQEGGASTRVALLEALRLQARPGLIVTA